MVQLLRCSLLTFNERDLSLPSPPLSSERWARLLARIWKRLTLPLLRRDFKLSGSPVGLWLSLALQNKRELHFCAQLKEGGGCGGIREMVCENQAAVDE